MNTRRFVTSTILGTILFLGGYSPAFAQDVTCPAQNLQAALDASDFVTFTGPCAEDIFIGRPTVTLSGDGVSSASVESVSILGAPGTVLRDFTVTAADGAGDDGLTVVRGSFATIVRLKINSASVAVFEDAGAVLVNSELIGPNNDNALSIFRDSSVRLQGGGNSITGNDSTNPTVSVNGSSYFGMISGNNTPLGGTSPVLRVRQSTAELRRGVITGDVIVDLHSAVSVGAGEFGGGTSNITLNGNVTISRDSALVFDIPDSGTVTFNGLMTCLDDESSVSGGPPTGNGVVLCTGFDQPAPVVPPFAPPAMGP